MSVWSSDRLYWECLKSLPTAKRPSMASMALFAPTSVYNDLGSITLQLQSLLSRRNLQLDTEYGVEQWSSHRNPRHPSDDTSDPPRLFHIRQRTVWNSSGVFSVPPAKPGSWKTWHSFGEPEVFGLWLTEGPKWASEADFGISRVCHG